MNPATSQIWWNDLASLPAVELYPGVTRRTLIDQDGYKLLTVRIEAGAKFLELDVHEPGPEEVIVLEGVFNDGVRDYAAGSFIHNPRGSSYIPQSSTGCTLLVFCPAVEQGLATVGIRDYRESSIGSHLRGSYG